MKGKQEEAKQRKESLRMQKQISKMHADIDHFKKHSLFRQQTLVKNVKMLEMYQKQHRKNVEVKFILCELIQFKLNEIKFTIIKQRNQYLQEMREFNVNRGIKMRKKIANKERGGDIPDKIMKNIQILQKKYIKEVDPADLDEVNRRLSLINLPYISDCVNKVCKTMYSLRIGVPSVVLAARAIKLIELHVIIIPEFGKTKCSSVQKRIARIILNTIVHIERERVKLIKEGIKKEQKFDEVQKPSKEKVQRKKSSVAHNEGAEVIGEACYGEFIGSLSNMASREITAIVRNTNKNYKAIS